MEVAAFVISIVALVATIVIPPYLEWLKKPDVLIHYESYNGRNLTILIQNMPRSSNFWDNIGLGKGTIQDLTINIKISDKSGNWNKEFNGFVDGDMRNRMLTFNDIKDTHISLPASKLRASFDMAILKTESVFLTDEDGNIGKSLPPGLYEVESLLCVNGKRRIETRDFKVNDREPRLEWVDPC
jgi:hypothetical protein